MHDFGRAVERDAELGEGPDHGIVDHRVRRHQPVDRERGELSRVRRVRDKRERQAVGERLAGRPGRQLQVVGEVPAFGTILRRNVSANVH
jgi:hypothetical protein